MRLDYDDLSWSEYLRYVDDLKAYAADIDEGYLVDHVVEECREEYRLAWYDYVSDFG